MTSGPASAPAVQPPRLEVREIAKAFPGVQALSAVSFAVAAGEVHALVGENGAGKSTLLKILSGTERADTGTVRIDGGLVSLASPKAARAAGIALIHQELQQVPQLDVAQNMFLGAQLTRGLFTDRRAMRARAASVLAPLDAAIDPATPLRSLSVAQRQTVEIAKALLTEARIIAMDEPTSSLTPREFERLAVVIAGLAARGVAIVYVSHKLEEVFRVASRATVLRDGRVVGTTPLAGTSEAALVGMMVGRTLEAWRHTSHVTSRVLLEVEGLARLPAVRGVSFQLHAGEVLGIAGLVGAGRTEIVRLVAGVDRPTAGTVRVDGQVARFASPRDAIAQGVALLPEERKKEGIVPLRPVLANVALPSLGRLSRAGLVRAGVVRADVLSVTRRVALRPPDVDRAIRLYSGGNQQKAILARWLMAEARVLIFDEPTRGIDVGAKSEIYQLIEALAAQGRGIVVVSSELPEILRLADRVLVVREGAIAGAIERAHMSEEAIMQLAVSGSGAAGRAA